MPDVDVAIFDLHDVLALAEHALTASAPSGQALALTPGTAGTPVTLNSLGPAETAPPPLPAATPFPDNPLLLADRMTLPLRSNDDPLDSLIAVIYQAVVYGHHWLTVERTADGSLEVDTAASMPAWTAPPEAKPMAAPVAIGTFGPFDAFIAKGYRWNGFDTPTFDLDTVRRIADALTAQPADDDQVSRIEIDGEQVTLVEQAGTEDEEHIAYLPDADGRYRVGSWRWCWTATEMPTVHRLRAPDLRFWFPWREVVALARHAGAAEVHEAVEYPQGKISTGPGLILATGHGTAVLASTGIPRWYTASGAVRTVAHLPLRHVHQPAADLGEHSALIALHRKNGRPIVGNMPDQFAGWMLINVWLELPGLDDVPLVTWHQAFTRDDLDSRQVRWRAAHVTCPQMPGLTYSGQIAEGISVGQDSVVARFTFETVQQIADDTAPLVRREAAVWVECNSVSVQVCRSAAEGSRLQMGWAQPDTDGMYVLGAHQLDWREVPDPQP